MNAKAVASLTRVAGMTLHQLDAYLGVVGSIQRDGLDECMSNEDACR